MWKIYGANNFFELGFKIRGISRMTILNLCDGFITFLGRFSRIEKFIGDDKQKNVNHTS